MRTAPIIIPSMTVILITPVIMDRPVSSPGGVPGTEVLIMAGMRGFPVPDSGARFSAGNGVNALSSGEMKVPFWRVMAKKENSGVSAE